MQLVQLEVLRMRELVKMAAERSRQYYNQHFLHADPSSRMAGSRATRYRNQKRRRSGESARDPPVAKDSPDCLEER